MNPHLAHAALYDADSGDFLGWETDETAKPIKTTAEMEVEELKLTVKHLLSQRQSEVWPAMKAMQEQLETQRAIVKSLRRQLSDLRKQNSQLIAERRSSK